MIRGMQTIRRRTLLGTALALPTLVTLPARSQTDAAAVAALRGGGTVLALRHALAPGTFDPPGYTLGDCRTQRNLSEAGRAQARRIGAWFQTQSLTPARVRSSPWCRCQDTAQLAFGGADTWAALGSPRGYTEQTNAEHLGQLQAALAGVAQRRAGFEVWVTHMFVLSALVQQGTDSGEGLVLRADGRGGVQVLGRVAPG